MDQRAEVDAAAMRERLLTGPDPHDHSCVVVLGQAVVGMGYLEVCDGMGQDGGSEHRGAEGLLGWTHRASWRIMEKLGMRREQHGVQDSWHADLGWVDGYTYAMLRSEWEARRGR